MGCIMCVHCEKLQREFLARTFALIALVHPVLHRVSAPKYYEMHRNISFGSNGVDWVRSLSKIPT